MRVATAGGDTAPFDAAAAHARLGGLSVLTATDPRAGNVSRQLATLGAHVTALALPLARDSQYVVGRLTLADRKAPTGSQLYLVVIDNRTSTPVHQMWSADQPAVSSGWDYGLERAAQRISWLHGMAEVATPDGSTTEGASLGWRPGTTTSIVFYAILDPDALPVTEVHRDLTIALVFLSPDRKVWWAQRLN